MDNGWATRQISTYCAIAHSGSGRPSAAATAEARAKAAARTTGEAAGYDQRAAIAGELPAGSPAAAALALFRRGGNDRADTGAEGHQLAVNPYAAKVSRSGAFHLSKELGVPGAQQKERHDD